MNWLIWCLTFLIATAQLLCWYLHLPEMVPSHFNGRGEVDGQMAKSGYCVLMGMFQLLSLVGLPLLGRILGGLPDSLVNMPNKEYWLAPSRREESLAVNFQVLLAISWLTGLLMIVVFELSARVAIRQRANIMPDMGIALTVYLVLVIGICGWLFYRFRMPRNVG